MAIRWRGKIEQSLQKTMQARRHEKIFAPHDIGHALQRIIDNRRDVIACRYILARKHRISPKRGIGGHVTDLRIGTGFPPIEVAASFCKGSFHVDPQRRVLARRNSPLLFFMRKMLTEENAGPKRRCRQFDIIMR